MVGRAFYLSGAKGSLSGLEFVQCASEIVRFETLFAMSIAVGKSKEDRLPLETQGKKPVLLKTMSAWINFQVWWRGLVAAAVAGGANGVITGFAAVGIDPTHFNLQAGLHSTLAIAAVSALMSGIIGVAAYLKQSPLPGGA